MLSRQTAAADAGGAAARRERRARRTARSRLGLRTASDLLFNFPRDYQDLSDERAIADLEEDQLQSIRCTVQEIAIANQGFGKSRVAILVHDGTGHLRATWFNQPFMRSQVSRRPAACCSRPNPRCRGMMWEMSHPQVTWLGRGRESARRAQAAAGIFTDRRALAVSYATDRVECGRRFRDVPEEVFPAYLLQQYRAVAAGRGDSRHSSTGRPEELERARRRFVFQELFVLQLAVSTRRASNERSRHRRCRRPPRSTPGFAGCCRLN